MVLVRRHLKRKKKETSREKTEVKKEVEMYNKEKDERYIKMCDCPEVQKYREKEFREGDVLANYKREWIDIDANHREAKKIFVGIVVFNKFTNITDRDLVIWLPRQSDIQDMLGYGFPFIARQFSAYVEDCTEPEKFGLVLKTQFTSMHEFWLDLYMREIYKKVWYFGHWKHIQIWDAREQEWVNAIPEEKKNEREVH